MSSSRRINGGKSSIEEAFKPKRALLVGYGGLGVEEFLAPATKWLQA